MTVEMKIIYHWAWWFTNFDDARCIDELSLIMLVIVIDLLI